MLKQELAKVCETAIFKSRKKDRVNKVEIQSPVHSSRQQKIEREHLLPKLNKLVKQKISHFHRDRHLKIVAILFG